jgi:hypothetical protein
MTPTASEWLPDEERMRIEQVTGLPLRGTEAQPDRRRMIELVG